MRGTLRFLTTVMTLAFAGACLAQTNPYAGSWRGTVESMRYRPYCIVTGPILYCGGAAPWSCVENGGWTGTVDAQGNFSMSTDHRFGYCGPSLVTFPQGVAYVGQISAYSTIQVPAQSVAGFSCNAYTFQFSYGAVSASYLCSHEGSTTTEGPCTITCLDWWAYTKYTGAPAGGVAAGNMPGPLSGLWWNSIETGWGIHFSQRRNVIFAAWYTYDANGDPKWYVASNCMLPAAEATSGTCNGTLYEVNGPTFFGTTFDPGAVNVLQAGSLSVSFQDTGKGLMTYTVGSQTRTVAIARQPISSGSVPVLDYTDLWWNPNESGWGLAITQQASVMFVVWYVYDSAGKPTWYVASNCAVSGSHCSGKLYRTTGPAFGPTFDWRQVRSFEVGTVTLTFSDPNNGTLSYTVDGVFGTKAITRQLF